MLLFDNDQVWLNYEEKPPKIVMTVFEEVYFMVTVKREPIAIAVARQLENDFNIKNVVIGPGFDYHKSIANNSLTPYPVATQIKGVYVPLSDFEKVEDMLGL